MLGTLTAIAGILGGGASLFGSIGPDRQGNNGLMNDAQFDRHQRQLNRGNPQEIARQNEFLAHTAPTNAMVYNYMQDQTYARDTARYQERMDTLYDGTSPWERLGSSAATGGGSGASPGNAGLDPTANTQFITQLTGQMANVEAAKISADAQVKSAQLSSGSKMLGDGITNLTTQRGQDITENLGLQQREIERVKNRILADGQFITQKRFDEQTANEQEGLLLRQYEIIKETLPRTKVETLLGEVTGFKGDELKEFYDSLGSSAGIQRIRLDSNIALGDQYRTVQNMLGAAGDQSQLLADVSSVSAGKTANKVREWSGKADEFGSDFLGGVENIVSALFGKAK